MQQKKDLKNRLFIFILTLMSPWALPWMYIKPLVIQPLLFQLLWSNVQDPSPWLIVSPELKVKLKSKPYDPKKSCWVPNKATHGYDEGLIETTDGEKVTVRIIEGREVKEKFAWGSDQFWPTTMILNFNRDKQGKQIRLLFALCSSLKDEVGPSFRTEQMSCTDHHCLRYIFTVRTHL